MKKIIPIIGSLILIFQIVLALYLASSLNFKSLASKNITFPRAFVVQSGSMEPAIKTGSVIFSYPKSNYKEGDIITFAPNGNFKNLVTHRVAARLYPNGATSEPVYKTSGDANEDFDTWQISNKQIVGRVVFSVPYIGYIANQAKKPYGFILLVVIPATIIIYEELKSLFGEIGKIIRKKKTVTSNPISRGSVLIPVMGAGLVFIGLTNSFFSDKEISSQNIMQVGTPVTTTPTISPTPTPSLTQVLVIHEVLPVSECKVGNDTAQWIEVYNGYGIPVNLKNFKITDGVNTVALVNANNIILNPGDFALLSHDNSIWNKCYSDNGTITANLGTGNLDLNTGVLELLDSGDITIDHVQWNTPSDSIPSLNKSIERNPLGFDSAIGNAWNPNDFVVRDVPTPGI